MTVQNESAKNAAGAPSAVAGFGFRAEATVASLRSALQAACAANKSATDQVPVLTALATAEDKAAHPALAQLAAELALPVVAVPLAQLAQLAQLAGHVGTLSAAPSAHVPERYGARSLAESAALSAAGPGARLLAPRAVSADHMAIAAIADLRVVNKHFT